jgi:hypothetical protein
VPISAARPPALAFPAPTTYRPTRRPNALHSAFRGTAPRRRLPPTLLASLLASALSSSLFQLELEELAQPAVARGQATRLRQLQVMQALALVCFSFLHFALPLTRPGGSSASETGASASASATSDSGNGAIRNTVAGVGLLGLVVAGLAL